MDKIRITSLDMLLLHEIEVESDKKARQQTKALLEFLDSRGLRDAWQDWVEYERRKNALTHPENEPSIP